MIKSKQERLIHNIIALDLLDSGKIDFDCARFKFVENININNEIELN